MLVAYALDDHIMVQQRLSFKIESSDQGLADLEQTPSQPASHVAVASTVLTTSQVTVYMYICIYVYMCCGLDWL